MHGYVLFMYIQGLFHLPLYISYRRSEGRKESPEGSTSPAEEPAALLRWRNAVSTATSSSQLGVCMNQLERCIAWEKSPMKVVS